MAVLSEVLNKYVGLDISPDLSVILKLLYNTRSGANACTSVANNYAHSLTFSFSPTYDHCQPSLNLY